MQEADATCRHRKVGTKERLAPGGLDDFFFLKLVGQVSGPRLASAYAYLNG